MSRSARNRRTILGAILALAFASVALIPSGFMPAAGRPFALEICPEGLPAGLLTEYGQPLAHHHHHHHGGPAQPSPHQHPGGIAAEAHCVFASVCGSGPTLDQPLAGRLRSAPPLCTASFVAGAIPPRVIHRPQPRAPPARFEPTSSG